MTSVVLYTDLQIIMLYLQYQSEIYLWAMWLSASVSLEGFVLRVYFILILIMIYKAGELRKH